MLAVVVAIFATLWLPYRTLLVYNSLLAMFGYDPYKDLWYLLFAKTCIFINSAINPILYNALSVKFRRAFKRMLSCGKARQEQWVMTMIYSDAGRRPPSRITGGGGLGGGIGGCGVSGVEASGKDSSFSTRIHYKASANEDPPSIDTTAFTNTNSPSLKVPN